MKTLSLWQPWASLVVEGVKTIETRSWPAPQSLIGQRIAIHAAAQRPTDGLIGDWITVQERSDGGDVLGYGLTNLTDDYAPYMDLPLGAIVGSCVVSACVPMCDPLEPSELPVLDATPDALRLMQIVEGDLHATYVEHQRPYGIFEPGRYAWILEDAQPTAERCPACWGTGWVPSPDAYLDHARPRCPVCAGVGHCEPIAAKGRQRVWEWTP